jgi:hypothetical protein
MTKDVAVTYTGTDNPFKDRIYRTGLTFTPGQTRLLPAPLAQRFLRHEDVFKEGAAGEAKAQVQPATEQDDTQKVLEQNQTQLEDQRLQEDARFTLLDSIDSMDREAVIAWAELHYKQNIRGNTSLAKAREMAKGFVDQYGMPA